MMKTSYEYDHQGRLLTEKLQMDDQAEITLAATKYNEIGEPLARYLHGSGDATNFNQQVDYTYNTRGWLKTINQPASLGDDLFALDLRYNDPDESNGLTALGLYNGNITEMMWHSTEDEAKGYGFGYDRLNRLTAANYGQGVSYANNQGYYNTSYGYDDNGNIDKLTRYKANTKIDSLNYSYPAWSNQLESVTDYTGLTDGYYAATANQYDYDKNGNMQYDPSKETHIDYNYLNLPKRVDFTLGTIRYVYNASGIKLMKNVSSGTNTLKMDYCGPFLYENDVLKCIFTSAGRILTFANDGSVLYKFEYELKDHLGNTRVVFGGHSSGKTELIQRTDYYPYGLVMAQQEYIAYDEMPNHEVLKNKYLYNGKEWQDDEFGNVKLNWYDYEARMYDPELGRWHSLDPKLEKYYSLSPYNYCDNNPAIFTDPKGDTIKWSSEMSKREIRYTKAALRRNFGSKVYRNMMKELKKSETVYTVTNKTALFESDPGSFEGKYIDNTLTLILGFNMPADGTNEIGINFDIANSNNMSKKDWGDVMGTYVLEEFVHAYQYDYYTKINGMNLSERPAKVNEEFEAKALVGFIQGQTGKKFLVGRGDIIPNSYGRSFGYTSGSYFPTMNTWRTDPYTHVRYRNKTVSNQLPGLLQSHLRK